MEDDPNSGRSPTPPPQLSASGRLQRRIRRLCKFDDFVPHHDGRLRLAPPCPPAHLPSEPEAGNALPTDISPPDYSHRNFHLWRTGKSDIGLYREYLYEPSYVPDLPGNLNLQPPEVPQLPPLVPTTSPPVDPPRPLLPLIPPLNDPPLIDPPLPLLVPPPSAPIDPPLPSPPSAESPLGPSTTATVPPASSDPEAPLRGKLGPLPNFTTFLLARWHFCKPTSTASNTHAQKQVDMWKEKRFGGWKVQDAQGIVYDKLKNLLSSWRPEVFSPHKGWKSASVFIDVPLGKKDPEKFEVPGLHYRSIPELLEKVVKTDPNRRSFHIHPFKEYVQRGNGEPERVICEAFSCDAVIEEYQKVNKLPPERLPCGGLCNLERVVFFIRLWSDATLLTNFGSTSLWPIYMCWANQSKYQHYRKGCRAVYDVAHIPKASPPSHWIC
jgi:Plavaka transposase